MRRRGLCGKTPVKEGGRGQKYPADGQHAKEKKQPARPQCGQRENKQVGQASPTHQGQE